MRTTFLLLALATLAHAEDLRANLAAKLGKPFVKNAAWVLDYDQALKSAKSSNKLVFAYFSRSYLP